MCVREETCSNMAQQISEYVRTFTKSRFECVLARFSNFQLVFLWSVSSFKLFPQGVFKHPNILFLYYTYYPVRIVLRPYSIGFLEVCKNCMQLLLEATIATLQYHLPKLC